ncbi:MAG: TauD/TfdA family dioxygenase [Candidatus Hydrogenedentota bacterium]
MNITKLNPAFGAQIDNVDLSTINDADFEEVYAAWVDYGVLRFRSQKLDDTQLEAFSARFGPLEKVPVKLTPEQIKKLPSIYVLGISNITVDGKPIGGLGNSEANWHSDMTYIDTPPPASVLLGMEIPEEGGNTQFSCQHAALDSLPETLRARIADLSIKHDASHTSVGELRRGFDDISDPSKVPGAIHPAILRHKENGRAALYLGRREFAYVEGLPLEESEALLDELWRYASLTENVWTQEWNIGDVIIWDNRRVLHRRDEFPNHMRRMMRRCQVLAREPQE